MAVCTGRGSMGLRPSLLVSAPQDHLEIGAEKMFLQTMPRQKGWQAGIQAGCGLFGCPPRFRGVYTGVRM